jgi:hypothetical protein
MAQTFEIRFARSAGFAGLFEAPANSFRWKGAGRLSIDAQGISIALKRGLLNWSWRARSRRIDAERLTEVYREGDELRLEFATDQSPRNQLPIWASTTGAAAEIVSLLPTRHTVELEHSTGSTHVYRLDQRLMYSLLAAVAVLLLGALLLQRQLAPIPASIETPTDLVSSSAELSSPLPDREPAGTSNQRTDSLPFEQMLAREGFKPIARASPAYPVARLHLDLFESELTALHSQYAIVRQQPNADALQELETRWWSVTLRIGASEQLSGAAFAGLREAQLAVCSSWRTSLALHAAGLRLGDKRLIELSESELEKARLFEYLVRSYVD